MSTGKDLSRAIKAVVGQQTQTGFPAAPARGAQPREAARGRPVAAAAKGGGGIASPLTENSVSERQYYAQGYKTTDGLFVIPAIKKATFTDADGNAVVINFANPSA